MLVGISNGISVKQGDHYIQMGLSKGFNQFDYGNVKLNQKKYGRDTPPPYNLTRVTVPINLYYSKDDTLVTEQNIVDLRDQLENVKSTYVVPIDGFNHFSFTTNPYIREFLNEEIINNI